MTITVPDDFRSAELLTFYDPLEMYFLWYGADEVKGYKYDGEHVLSLPLFNDISIWQAKTAISRYCRGFEKEENDNGSNDTT